MGISERKLKDKEKIREKILHAAMKLFVKEGYENVSMRKISQKIEYSPGTIYLHFKDKESMLFELHKIAFDKFYEKLSSSNDEPEPLKRLYKMGENYLNFAFENPEYYDLMFINNCVSDSIENAETWVGHNSFELLRKNMADCAEHGYIHKQDVDVSAFSMWVFVHGIASLAIKKRLTGVPEEFLKNTIFGSLSYLTNLLNIKKHKQTK